MPGQEGFYDRITRRRREEGIDWDEAAELKWLRRHPEDAPPGWVDPETGLPPNNGYVHDDDVIPDVEVNEHYKDELAPYLDIDILDAYDKWVGKKREDANGRREGIKVSCPNPHHRDDDPSAWVNLDKQVWYCGGCAEGGDIFDLYARQRDWPNYKPEFHKLRKAMATELGYVEPEPSLSLPEDDPTEALPGAATDTTPEPLARVVPLVVVEPGDEPTGTFDGGYSVEWKALLPENTFLRVYMDATAEQDDLPHEYYLLPGFQLVAFAAGNDVQLLDNPPVKPNLYIITYGKTGAGKSRAAGVQNQILKLALPFDGDEHTPSRGVRSIPTPGSAEALIKSFSHPIHDMSMAFMYYAAVRGIIRIDEFAAFIARTARPGSHLKATLIEAFDANGGDIENHAIGSGHVKAHAPFAQMLSTTQPKAIHEFMGRGDVESGFMNRFIFAVGIRRVERRAFATALFDLDKSVEMLKELHDWCEPRHVMQFIPGSDAAKKWEQVFRNDLLPLIDHPDETMWTRLDLLCKKLILIFCINEKQPAITADIIERVASLIPYLAKCQGMFSDDLNYNTFEECLSACRKVVKEIQKKKDEKKDPKPVTNRLIYQRLYKKYPSEMIDKAIYLNQKLGKLVPETRPNKHGPATEGFRLI